MDFSMLENLASVSLRSADYTNQHAYPVMAEYFNDLARLDQIDWAILQRRDFKHDPDDPGEKERYQAEALIHRHLPVDALAGIVCYNQQTKGFVETELKARRIDLRILIASGIC